MPYFALMYEVVDDFVARRATFRDEHLRLANASNARGELLFAGALSDPVGALLVFRCVNKSVAEDFAQHDPYVTNGLVKKWAVRPWTVVVGQDASDMSPSGRLQ
jgi:hypothetical protein